MKKLIDITFEDIKEPFDGVLLLGDFDGVHLGHASLVKEALNHSDYIAVLLFKNHPLDIFKPEEKHYCLTPLEDKIRRFNNLGVETFYIINNDRGFYNHSKEEFIAFLKRINPKMIVVGEDYTFGKGKKGDSLYLKRYFDASIVPLLKCGGQKIGSRYIQEDILNGNIESANKALGYDYEVKGHVAKGLGNGHKLGFPTANLEMDLPYLLPKTGVYFGYGYVRGIPKKAIINVGKNPTVGVLRHRIVEAYIADLNEDIYGEFIYIAFERFLREEKKFASLDELKAQLEHDKKYLI